MVEIFEKKRIKKLGTRASLAQRLERSAVNRKVAGSIPAGGVFRLIDVEFLWGAESERWEKVENLGIDPSASRMLSERSTI